MTEYRNTGAPIHREDGGVVESGETFEPTDHERRTRAHKLEPVGEPDPEPKPDPLAGIDFASDAARALAEEEGLESDDFDGHLGTGQGHAFVKSDVEQVVEAD